MNDDTNKIKSETAERTDAGSVSLSCWLASIQTFLQGKIEEAVTDRDECDKDVPRYYLMDGRKEAYIEIKRFLKKYAG